MALERLQKLLARAGLASRRGAERYIVEGRVKVNGKVVRELGSKADPKKDVITVEGLGAIQPERFAYIALHKPIHVVTTVRDPEGRQTVLDVLRLSNAKGKHQAEIDIPRVFPVGRLDFDAEGLLLLTNDGELANSLMHPRYHVPKTYVVKVKGKPSDASIERLRKGVRLRQEDGRMSRPTAPADVRVLKQSPANTWLELVIVEGRHHQVKRMCESVGHFVIRLIRTELGGITLDPLQAGEWRFLTTAEVDKLRAWPSARDHAPTPARPARAKPSPPSRPAKPVAQGRASRRSAPARKRR